MVLAVVVAAGLSLPASPARADSGDPPPSDHLVYAGLGMALPTYFLNVTLHEGSHALAARAFGAEIIRFRLLPGRVPETGNFYFGYTRYRGRLSRGQKTVFFLAPKITDSLALGGYAALLGLGAWPDNRYGRVAIVVLATGFWVDFSKELFSFWGRTDVERALTLNGADTVWERLPWRALHAALAVGAGYLVYRGYEKVFETPTTTTLPLLSTSF